MGGTSAGKLKMPGAINFPRWRNNMKTIERLLFKILVVQTVILISVRLLFHFSKAEPYLSKVVQYEGVNNMKIGEWIETFKP